MRAQCQPLASAGMCFERPRASHAQRRPHWEMHMDCPARRADGGCVAVPGDVPLLELASTGCFLIELSAAFVLDGDVQTGDLCCCRRSFKDETYVREGQLKCAVVETESATERSSNGVSDTACSRKQEACRAITGCHCRRYLTNREDANLGTGRAASVVFLDRLR